MTGEDDISEPEVLEHLQKQERIRKAHHQENIQILVALSLFAGYITAFFNDMFSISILNAAATVFATFVFIFLIYKLVINSSAPFNDVLASKRLDRAISSLYLLSVIGFALVAVIIIATAQFNISLSRIEPELLSIPLVIITFGSYFGLWYYVGISTKESLKVQEVKLREEMPEALKMLEEAGYIDEPKRKALKERVEVLLDKDNKRDPGWFMLGGKRLGPSSQRNLLRLDHEARGYLLDVIERIKRESKHGAVSRSDKNKITIIIENAEEGT